MILYKKSSLRSFSKKTLLFLFSIIILVFCGHFLKASSPFLISSLQKKSQIIIFSSPLTFILSKDLCQKRDRLLASKKPTQRKASFLSQNKTLTLFKIYYANWFFFPLKALNENYFLVDQSYRLLHLDILSSRSHPPTSLFC